MFHDAGFTRKYDNNEPIGAAIAKAILPQYGYNIDQIAKVCELILVTQIPQKPNTLLEKIICDADLDYLGKKDFEEIADSLKNELVFYGKIDPESWDEIQIRFLEKHTYFTATSIKLREAKKQENIAPIRARVKAARASKEN